LSLFELCDATGVSTVVWVFDPYQVFSSSSSSL